MLLDKSIEELSIAIKSESLSLTELISQTYAHINKLNNRYHDFITIVDQKTAEKKAQKLQAKLTSKSSPLFGLPFVMKDAYVTKGTKTTSGSKVLDGYIPQYNATVYQKLEDSGAILVGKMNQDAWGHGGSSENTDFNTIKNPWDITRVAGGSSGGPAVSVATRTSAFAIGEDTGGSIRNPAAWTNTSGLKVTYGRVSRYGAIAYASSFDTVGPMAKSVADLAYILEVIVGQDPFDATSSPEPVKPYVKLLSQLVKGKIIGFPKELLEKVSNQDIKTATLTALKKLEEIGFTIQEVFMPKLEYGLSVYYLIAPSETSSNLGRYDAVRYGLSRQHFTDETKRRVMIGTYALSSGYYDAYYRQAQKVRTMIIDEYQKIFSSCDAILMPVNPTPPPKIGDLVSDPLQNLLADIFTTTQNPVGVPSLAIPCGFTKDQLPIGMQLVGPKFSEDLLMAMGHAYQQATNWHLQKPIL